MCADSLVFSTVGSVFVHGSSFLKSLTPPLRRPTPLRSVDYGVRAHTHKHTHSFVKLFKHHENGPHCNNTKCSDIPTMEIAQLSLVQRNALSLEKLKVF